MGLYRQIYHRKLVPQGVHVRLLTAQAWIQKYFAEECRPAEITLHRWLRQGKIPGRKVGGTWYVDEHAWLADGDDLVQRVLDEAS